MAELSAAAIERIADARRKDESELKKALSAVAAETGETDVMAYLPAYVSFACTQFDAEAGEWIYVCEDANAFQAMLENEVAPRIIEGILPNRGLDSVSAQLTDETDPPSSEQDVVTGLLWEVEKDGTQKPPSRYTLGQSAKHGDWENFAPESVWYLARRRSNNPTIRAALSQALQQRMFYWATQFQLRRAAGAHGARSNRQPGSRGKGETYETNFGSNVDRLRKECGWSLDELAAKTGLDKKLILGHINKGKSKHPRTVRTYADAFTKHLNRAVTAADLEG